MSQTDKSALYNELKAAGVTFDKHYREYSTEELQEAVDRLHEQPEYHQNVEDRQELTPPPTFEDEQLAAVNAYIGGDEDPVRIDEENGITWYREEVRKPAYPKPRARRVLKYIDTGSETRTVQDGRFLESFEVPGMERRQAEVKITMPSFQVGVYKDRRFPFKIHVYNEVRGFDLFEVQQFYGGADLVPSEIKRMYVANDLCYDIRTTIRAIEAEYRRNQLKGIEA